MSRYSGDPRWIKARFTSRCSRKCCHREIKKGDDAFYYPNGKKILCDADECGGQASRDFAAAAADDAMMGGY